MRKKKVLLGAVLVIIILVVALVVCLKCKHERTEIVKEVAASCEEEGYSGDTYCLDCEKIINKGHAIDALGHTPSELTNVSEARCKTDGYTGDILCITCGANITRGEAIPATGHMLGEAYNVTEATCTKKGYTGDRDCAACGATVQGEEYERLLHDYVDNICTKCGWHVPGFYVDDKMEMSWEELINMDIIILDSYLDHRIKKVKRMLPGTLYISEDITQLESRNVFDNTGADVINMPYTFTEAYGFANCAAREINFYGELTDIWNNAFRNTPIESFAIPEGVTRIHEAAFENCEKLTSVTFPSSLEYIDAWAFKNTGITELSLPEGLKDMQGACFAGCNSLENIVLPSTVVDHHSDYLNRASNEWFENCKNLKSVDLSQTTVTSTRGHMAGLFTGCTNLLEVKLPETIVDAFFSGCKSLQSLDLPDGVKYVDISGCDSLNSIVLPESVASFTIGKKSKIDVVYYRGSELMWSLMDVDDREKIGELILDYKD